MNKSNLLEFINEQANNPELERHLAISKYLLGKEISRDIRVNKLHSIYELNSKYFDRCHEALQKIEHDYIKELILELGQKNVAGDLAEFGIYQGAWINRLYEMTEGTEMGTRHIYGFDSFQGLSKPHPEFDPPVWKEGAYSVSLKEVESNVQAEIRPRIKLIPGWFIDSLTTPEAQSISNIAFARIDCDIYEPAKQCLEYLSSRLSHGAILVFDDWSYSFEYGEGKAFLEWASTQPNLEFKFIFSGPWDSFHLRVLHRDKPNIF